MIESKTRYKPFRIVGQYDLKGKQDFVYQLLQGLYKEVYCQVINSLCTSVCDSDRKIVFRIRAVGDVSENDWSVNDSAVQPCATT